ncbi:hypothetical protein ACFL1N_11100 [Thermodesulfobacteriota bacterium]
MTEKVTCRRCSVLRVNTLCRLYEEGFIESNEDSRKQLITLVNISKERGYNEGALVLNPDLKKDHVRKICWNISSLLTDKDFNRHGVSLNGK